MYAVNEIFYSIQGEGVRAGTANLFLRFAGCNLQCRAETEGFDCDTEFASSCKMTSEQILAALKAASPNCRWIILTGGEPSLQLDAALVRELKAVGYLLAIETNGTRDVSALNLDWVTVSPKTAEHTIRQTWAHEVKYVRAKGQGIPKPSCLAEWKVLSPAFGDNTRENLTWCIELVRQNPEWRLSVQQHKLWSVR